MNDWALTLVIGVLALLLAIGVGIVVALMG